MRTAGMIIRIIPNPTDSSNKDKAELYNYLLGENSNSSDEPSVQPSNYWLSNDNVPNYGSNVTDIKQNYDVEKNFDGLQQISVYQNRLHFKYKKGLHMFLELDLIPEDELNDYPSWRGSSGGKLKQVGLEWGIIQSKELIKNNVPVLHFYTMGKGEAVKNIAVEVF